MFVYVIEGPHGVKVGRSRRPERRCSNLQSATPFFLKLARRCACANAASIERAAHKLLAPWKLGGEWFGCTIGIAQIAIEAATDDCGHRRAFLEACAIINTRADVAVRLEQWKLIEATFPDLATRPHVAEAPFLTEETRAVLRHQPEAMRLEAERAVERCRAALTRLRSMHKPKRAKP